MTHPQEEQTSADSTTTTQLTVNEQWLPEASDCTTGTTGTTVFQQQTSAHLSLTAGGF